MRRREFVTLLGGAAAWPLAARAQQPAKLPTIGFLGESTPVAQSERTAAFVQRLRELGWIEGRTVAIEYRWAEGRSERFAEIATEQAAARALGLEVTTLEIRRAEDIAPAFEAIEGRADAAYLPTEPLVLTNRVRINTMALGARLPTIYSGREYVESAGLMSYGPNRPDLFRRAGDIADKILRGVKPGDIPVEQPTKFDLVINLTTAKALRQLGLVASLARPGGNLTGINFFNVEVTAKRLEPLRELVPGATRVVVLVNPANPATEITLRDVEPAARAVGLQLQVLKASNSREIDAAFATFVRERPDALFVGGDSFFVSRRFQLVNLASRHAIPATFSNRDFAEVGGLISYGANPTDAHRQIGVYAGRILKGAKPADLPVVQASKLELVINAQTARTIGLTVPPSLLAIADEVIE